MIKTLIFDFAQVLYLFNPDGSTELNHSLLEFLQEIAADYEMYAFSATSPHILAAVKPQLVPPLLDLLSARELGINKSDPQGYTFLAQKLKKNPDEIVFIDDTWANVAAAQSAGLQVILFESTTQFIRDFKKLTK